MFVSKVIFWNGEQFLAKVWTGQYPIVLTYSVFAILENLMYSKPKQKLHCIYISHVYEYPTRHSKAMKEQEFTLAEILISLALI